MKTENIIDGMRTLLKYSTDKYTIGAEHDVIYFYATPEPVSRSDLETLVELGWFQPEANYDDDFTADAYDPEEGWACYP